MLSLNKTVVYIYIPLPASRPWAKDFNTADPCGYKSYYRNKGQGPFMAAPGGEHPELVDPKEFIVVSYVRFFGYGSLVNLTKNNDGTTGIFILICSLGYTWDSLWEFHSKLQWLTPFPIIWWDSHFWSLQVFPKKVQSPWCRHPGISPGGHFPLFSIQKLDEHWGTPNFIKPRFLGFTLHS